MSKEQEMSPFGKMLFEAFSSITKAQAELVKAQQTLSLTVVEMHEERVKRDNAFRSTPSAIDELKKHNPQLNLKDEPPIHPPRVNDTAGFVSDVEKKNQD